MEKKAEILFVDDEERIVSLLRMMFRGKYKVHTATSGQQALECIARNKIDVIVSDQRMPEMQGIELLSEVRRRSPATMRILLTGYSDLAAITGSVNDGEVFRFINKPWDQDDIKRIIDEAAQAAQASEAASTLAARQDETVLDLSGEHSSVLVIDDNASDRQAMARVLGDLFMVYTAPDIPTALKLLEERDIGVIVSEARVKGRDVGELLSILKRHYPLLTTVMLTNSVDSDLIIRLINRAQIFRFAPKPVRVASFRLAVAAAMREHKRFQMHPDLMQRHRVAASPEVEDAALVSRIASGLSRMRARFARLLGAA